MSLIAQGAEAKLIRKKDVLVKERFAKGYRLKEIDKQLRQFRTRREAKILDTLHKNGFPCPHLLGADDVSMEIQMEFIDGKKVRDVLSVKNDQVFGKEIGLLISRMHNLNIVHGDLTTSNMIYFHKKIYFIDFGLSIFSQKVEDKAVDLHLLKQALESTHYRIWEKVYAAVEAEYRKKAVLGKEILQRLEIVDGRGRYKGRES